MVDALREHGLVERTLVSSNWMRSLVVIRALEPRLRLGWSVPRVRARLDRLAADQAAGLRRDRASCAARLPGAYARHHAARAAATR